MENTDPQPSTVPAVECSACHKLIPASRKYLHVKSFVAKTHPDEDAHPSQRQKQLERKYTMTNLVFCDEGCFGNKLQSARGMEV